jgi:hypothetical protein
VIARFHAYWGGGPLSWLRWLTLKTFRQQNPDWEMTLYVPAVPSGRKPEWPDPPHKVAYTGPDWLKKVRKLDVEVEAVDFEKIGFSNDAHPAHKSDYLRWHLLDTVGGFWSDMDVLYFHPLPSGDLEKFDFSITADAWPAVYYIAYIYARPGTSMTRHIRKESARHYRADQYQCLGCQMLQILYPDARRFHIYHPELRVGILPARTNIPVPWGDVGRFFTGFMNERIDLSDSIGLHWFGGSDLSEAWENLLTEKEYRKHDSPVCHILKALLDDKPLALHWPPAAKDA